MRGVASRPKPECHRWSDGAVGAAVDRAGDARHRITGRVQPVDHGAVEVEHACIGVGPGREQTIVRRDVLQGRP